eukprot:PITA_35381
MGKSVYYVSFIDDFSRNTWIYFLKKKYEVFDRFKEFKAPVENQTENKIKFLRIDNGGEFCSKEFEEFYKKCGIAQQKTTLYTPQQNGVAMNEQDVDGKGKKHAQWCREKQTKLDSKYEKCIFIGYKDGLKGYKLWNPTIRKVIYSRDVVFREVKYVTKHEVQPKEIEKIEFELKDEESDSTTEEESEDEEPQTLGEAVDSEDGKLWKEAMVDEMAYLHKNEAWDLVELSA